MKMDFKVSWIVYLVGFVGAALVGLLEGMGSMPELEYVPWVLVAVGLAIGALNVTNKEAVPVMVSALVLGAAVGVLALLPSIGGIMESIFVKIAALSIPIAIPVGLKTLIESAR